MATESVKEFVNPKRIKKELKRLEKNRDNLEKCGIHFKISKTFGTVYVMIIGQSNTPYHHGFYFFTINYDINHPFEPIKVKYMMNNKYKTRMNPNLYVYGKVCLSLINTWFGEGWLPTVRIDNVMLALCSDIINKEFPLFNEPGVRSKDRAIQYNNLINHQNIQISIFEVLNNLYMKKSTEKRFENIIKDYFLKNYSDIITIIKNNILIYSEHPTFKPPMYGVTPVKNEYKNLLVKIEDIHSKMFET